MDSSFYQSIDLPNNNPLSKPKSSLPTQKFFKSATVFKIIIFIISIIVFIAIISYIIASKLSQKPQPIPTATTLPTPTMTITIPTNIPQSYLDKLNQIESEINVSWKLSSPEINLDLNL